MKSRFKLATSLAIIFVLSACGAGSNAQSLQEYAAAEGANYRAGSVWVLNAVFVDNGDGSATLSSSLLNRTEGETSLVSVSASTPEGEALTIASVNPITLKPAVLYPSGVSTADVVLTSDKIAGEVIRVVFSFSGADPVEMFIPLVPRVAHWEQVQPANAPATTN